ncbi:DNA replication complex GINS protein PSF2-like [Eleutherodactylus coqui]|uniref:DNA replication complex GINS protein PSF2-like n=1 Tax=Eleutherodactylus coqui TaxID=57060 RepID=UPI00346197B5
MFWDLIGAPGSAGKQWAEPAEVEFLAEKQLVTVIPNFSLDKVYLIGGDLGPFNPGLPVQVPLWLAVNLKQRQKGCIVPPEWMDIGKLEEIEIMNGGRRRSHRCRILIT